MAQHVLNDSDVRINPATEDKQDTIITALSPVAAGYTLTHLCIAQVAAGYTTLGYHASKATYLLRLKGTVDAGGTMGIYSADDAAGTNKIALSGPQSIGAMGGPHAEEENDVRMAMKAPTGKYLLMLTATSKFAGRAVTAEAS